MQAKKERADVVFFDLVSKKPVFRAVRFLVVGVVANLQQLAHFFLKGELPKCCSYPFLVLMFAGF